MAIQKLNFIDSYDFSNTGFHIISKILNFISYLFNLPIRFYTVLSINYYLHCIKKNGFDNVLNIKNQEEESIEGKVVCWNIQYGNGFFRPDTFAPMIEFLQTQNASVYLFQEVIISREINQHEILKEKLNMKFSLFNASKKFANLEYGNLILSNTPIDNIIIRKEYQSIDINLYDNPLTLVNVHLTCDITCYRQTKQLDYLEKDMCQKENGCLVLGDFNLPPWSKTIKRLRNNIREIKNGSYTYPSDYPLVKYDYAFMLEKGETKFPNISLNVIPDINYSDHLPMVIQISKDTLKLR